MRTAISQITTYPAPLEADLPAYSAAGFRAVELSMEKAQRFLKSNSIERLHALLYRNRLRPSGAISLAPSGPALLLSAGANINEYLDSLRRQLRLCDALGIPVLGVGADARRWMTAEKWRRQAIANLRKAAALAADHGVTLALEFMSLGPPIGPFVLDTLAETLALVEEAEHPALGISIDFFHHFRGGGTAADIEKVPAGRIANVHVTDVAGGVAAGSLADSDRVLPGEGVAPVSAYRDAILAAGYEGYWTLELLNEGLWKLDVEEAAALSARAMHHFATESRSG
jgi:sugar phosphate isomerase/epimerase